MRQPSWRDFALFLQVFLENGLFGVALIGNQSEFIYICERYASMIYKICSEGEWADASISRRYGGSQDDVRDGFIHFSTAAQLKASLDKHFAGQMDLVLVAVDEVALGDALKWEMSRGGALFPHLYQELDVAHVGWVKPLPLGGE